MPHCFARTMASIKCCVECAVPARGGSVMIRVEPSDDFTKTTVTTTIVANECTIAENDFEFVDKVEPAQQDIGKKILTAGKYARKTFADAARETKYVKWIRAHASQVLDPSLLEFIEFLNAEPLP